MVIITLAFPAFSLTTTPLYSPGSPLAAALLYFPDSLLTADLLYSLVPQQIPD